MHNRRSMSRLPSRARQAGFTLMEIIVVVILIGLIVTYAASRILNNADRAKANLAKATVQTVAEKIQLFEMDTGRLPASLDELVDKPGDVSYWTGPYVKASEIKDPWNHTYEYASPGQSEPFDLSSLGKDGRPGGEGVNADIPYQN